MKTSLLAIVSALLLSTSAFAEPLVKFIANDFDACDETGACTVVKIAYDGASNVSTVSMAPALQVVLLDIEGQIASTDTMTKSQSELLKLKRAIQSTAKAFPSTFSCGNTSVRYTIGESEFLEETNMACSVEFKVHDKVYNIIDTVLLTMVDEDGWILPKYSNTQKAIVGLTQSIARNR